MHKSPARDATPPSPQTPATPGGAVSPPAGAPAPLHATNGSAPPDPSDPPHPHPPTNHGVLAAARNAARWTGGATYGALTRAARWVTSSTLQPAWLPARWRHPATGYLAAALGQIGASALAAALNALIPGLGFRSVLLLLVTVLVALTFGAGPSLFAALIGAVLVNALIVPPPYAFSFTPSLGQASILLFLAVGVAISILASQSARAQRTAEQAGAEALAARAEAAGRAEQFQTAFDAMGDAVLLYDADQRLIRHNAALSRMLRLDLAPDAATLPDELRYTPLAVHDSEGQVVPHDQMPQIRALRGASFTRERAIDLRMSAFDGRALDVSVSAAPVRDARGQIIGSVAIYRDVTDRRRGDQRTRDALGALLEMAQALVSTAPDPTPPSLNGDNPQADSDLANGVYASAARGANGANGANGVTEGQRDAASSRPIAPAREAARRLAELTQHVLGCTRVAITAVNPETEQIRPLAIVGLTPEQEALIFATWSDNVRLGDSVSAPDLARLRAGEILTNDVGEEGVNEPNNPYHARSILLAPGLLGSKLVCLLTVDYASDPHIYTEQEQALAGAVTQLVTLVVERERLAQERAQAQARELALRASQEQMDRFLSLASHELRTPLTTMKASIQMTARRVTRLAAQRETPLASARDGFQGFQAALRRLGGHRTDAQREPAREPPPDAPHEPHEPHEPWVKLPLTEIKDLERLLGRAQEAVARQERLVSDLLDVSRIRANQLENHPARLDLGALTRDAIEEQILAYPTRVITFSQPDTPVTIWADGDRIRQALANYLINALRYAPVNRPVSVNVTRDKASGVARVTIHDEGPGVALEERPRIWERFHRTPGVNHTSGSGVGLGLGLYISREIIRAHGGQVGVDGEPGHGADFWFTLPLATDATAS